MLKFLFIPRMVIKNNFYCVATRPETSHNLRWCAHCILFIRFEAWQWCFFRIGEIRCTITAQSWRESFRSPITAFSPASTSRFRCSTVLLVNGLCSTVDRCVTEFVLIVSSIAEARQWLSLSLMHRALALKLIYCFKTISAAYCALAFAIGLIQQFPLSSYLRWKT